MTSTCAVEPKAKSANQTNNWTVAYGTGLGYLAAGSHSRSRMIDGTKVSTIAVREQRRYTGWQPTHPARRVVRSTRNRCVESSAVPAKGNLQQSFLQRIRDDPSRAQSSERADPFGVLNAVHHPSWNLCICTRWILWRTCGTSISEMFVDEYFQLFTASRTCQGSRLASAE